MIRFAMALFCLAYLFGETPDHVLAERDLEKRSELALKEADTQLTAAGNAYTAGDIESFRKAVSAVGEMSELSLKSLQDSGKSARKSPKYFKRAELKLRTVLRRLDSLERAVSVDDRPPVEKAKEIASEAHEQILHDIMSKR